MEEHHTTAPGRREHLARCADFDCPTCRIELARPMAHLCVAGPLCAIWYEPVRALRYGSPESDGCGHDSCWEVCMRPCAACDAEAGEALAAAAAKDVI